MIYLDNAATTPVTPTMLAAFNKSIDVFGNPSSVHSVGRIVSEQISEIKKNIMDFLGAKTGTIIFTSGGSESNNLAILGMVDYLNMNNKKTIITSQIEHPSVLNTCKEMENQGFKVIYMPVMEDGRIDIEELDKIMSKNKEDLGLVSIQAINNEVGSIQLIEDIGYLCDIYNVPFHTDAVQAIGHMDIDVEKDNISMLSLSGHKIHTPKGIGALYVKNPTILSPIIYGGGQQTNLRSGTENTFGIFCLDEAFTRMKVRKVSCSGYIVDLHKHFLKELDTAMKNKNMTYKINVPYSAEHIISLCIPKVEGNSLLAMLDSDGVCVSTGSACSSNNLSASHVLKAIGLSDEDALCTIRVSLSSCNSMDEMGVAAEKIVGSAVQLFRLVEKDNNSES